MKPTGFQVFCIVLGCVVVCLVLAALFALVGLLATTQTVILVTH